MLPYRCAKSEIDFRVDGKRLRNCPPIFRCKLDARTSNFCACVRLLHWRAESKGWRLQKTSKSGAHGRFPARLTLIASVDAVDAQGNQLVDGEVVHAA